MYVVCLCVLCLSIVLGAYSIAVLIDESLIEHRTGQHKAKGNHWRMGVSCLVGNSPIPINKFSVGERERAKKKIELNFIPLIFLDL